MANKSRLPLAKNAVRKSRTLRHPGVIKVLDTIEVCSLFEGGRFVELEADDSQTESSLYIVTERVVPLSWQVKRRSLSEETAKWGLYSVSVRIFSLPCWRVTDMTTVAVHSKIHQ